MLVASLGGPLRFNMAPPYSCLGISNVYMTSGCSMDDQVQPSGRQWVLQKPIAKSSQRLGDLWKCTLQF